MDLPVNTALRVQLYAWRVTGPVTLQLVMRKKGGPLIFQDQVIATIAADGLTTFTQPLLADELVAYSLSQQGAGADGCCMAVVTLMYQSGAAYVQGPCLSWGAVYLQPIHSWSEVSQITSPQIQSPNFAVQIGAPAAGSPVQITNNFAAFELVSFNTSLVTDATVASRILQVQYQTQSLGNAATIWSNQSTPASSTVLLGGAQQGVFLGTSSVIQTMAIPSIITPEGANLRITALNIQATDQFTATVANVRMFPPLSTI